MKLPLVHIIILNWNNWRDTLDCVRSLASSSYRNIRIVIVDNGSTDDSVQQFKLNAPDCRLIRSSRNLGFSGGNNLGIEDAIRSDAEYVWLLNNDTKPDPHCLSALVAKAQSNPQLGAVGSVLTYMHAPDKVQAWGGGSINFVLGRSAHHTAPSNNQELTYLTAASLLLRTKALASIDLFDEGFFLYWEDADLSLRLRAKGWQLDVANDARVLHRESASLEGRLPARDVYYSRSIVRFFRKHSRVPQIPIALSFTTRVAMRILRGEWDRAGAVVKGTFT
jgi:GT2 family glycosyltransferase